MWNNWFNRSWWCWAAGTGRDIAPGNVGKLNKSRNSLNPVCSIEGNGAYDYYTNNDKQENNQPSFPVACIFRHF